MTDHDIPESLLTPGLGELWEVVRRGLDRNGPHWRGTITLPDLNRASDLSLSSLLGRKPTRRLDLATLETALVRRHVGGDLSDAISRLGYTPSAAATERRAAQARVRTARAALANAIESWEEPWASKWADDLQRSGIIGGLDGDAVGGLAADVRRLLDHFEEAANQGASRTQLAATLFGSAHALDRGRKLTTVAESALRHCIVGGTGLEGRELWQAAGILADRVSAPVLTWSIPVVGTSPLAVQTHAATSGALPVHISLAAVAEVPDQRAARLTGTGRREPTAGRGGRRARTAGLLWWRRTATPPPRYGPCSASCGAPAPASCTTATSTQPDSPSAAACRREAVSPG